MGGKFGEVIIKIMGEANYTETLSVNQRHFDPRLLIMLSYAADVPFTTSMIQTARPAAV